MDWGSLSKELLRIVTELGDPNEKDFLGNWGILKELIRGVGGVGVIVSLASAL